MPTSDEPYTIVLNDLRTECPTLAKLLSHAEEVRRARLDYFLKNTGRLQGLEEFANFLLAATQWFETFIELRPITWLLIRAGADVVTAIEATISGYHAVAWESMRDVMEIELLLEEFALDHAMMERWERSNQRERQKFFSHGELRKGKAKREGIDLKDLSDTHDYRGHSVVLHVNPQSNPFGGRGLSREAVDVGADACFWDIYQHARNLFIVILALFGTFNEGRDVAGWKPPNVDRFLDEYKEAKSMEAKIMSKLKSIEEDENENDMPIDAT